MKGHTQQYKCKDCERRFVGSHIMIGHIHPQHCQHRVYKKSLSENLKGFVVGAEGVEPPTLCL